MKYWQETKDPRIKKRGDVYWARFQKRNQIVQESLNTRSFETAKRMVEEIESCILLGVDWRREHELFETAWPDFLIDKAQGNKTKIARPKTLYEYTQFGETKFMPFFRDYRVSEVGGAWEDFVKHIRVDKPDIQFANMRKYLMGFLSWAKRKGKIRDMPELFDPDLKLKQDEGDEEEDDSIGQEYTPAEAKAFWRLAEGPLKLYVGLGQFNAMRSSEITQLRKNRVVRSHQVIRLRASDTKTAQARVVPVHSVVWPYLLKQIDAHPDSPFVFPNKKKSASSRPMDRTGFKGSWAALRLAVKEELGLPDDWSKRFHDWKHTWISNAIRSGMNPVIISKVSGTSIKVIMDVYLHLTEDDLHKDMAKWSIKSDLDKNCRTTVFGEGEKELNL